MAATNLSEEEVRTAVDGLIGIVAEETIIWVGHIVKIFFYQDIDQISQENYSIRNIEKLETTRQEESFIRNARNQQRNDKRPRINHKD